MNDCPDYRDPDAIREHVMAFMHRTGAHRDLLTDRQWGFVWLCGDGFGTVSESFARRACWDWSHVRDSSDEGFYRMAEAIEMILRKISCPECGNLDPDDDRIAAGMKCGPCSYGC